MSSSTTNTSVNPALYSALEYRNIGPHRGGRVVAVAGDPNHRQTFSFGSTGGWTTVDGKTWNAPDVIVV